MVQLFDNISFPNAQVMLLSISTLRCERRIRRRSYNAKQDKRRLGLGIWPWCQTTLVSGFVLFTHKYMSAVGWLHSNLNLLTSILVHRLFYIQSLDMFSILECCPFQKAGNLASWIYPFIRVRNRHLRWCTRLDKIHCGWKSLIARSHVEVLTRKADNK